MSWSQGCFFTLEGWRGPETEPSSPGPQPGGSFLGRAAPGTQVLSVSVMTSSEAVLWNTCGSLGVPRVTMEKSCVRPSYVAFVSGDSKVV